MRFGYLLALALCIPASASVAQVSSLHGNVVLLERWTADGVTASKTFSSIPAGYSALRLTISGRGTNVANQNVQIQFNGDTGSNYDWQIGTANDTAVMNGVSVVGTTSLFAGAVPGTGDTADLPGIADVIIPRYSDTTFRKGIVGTAYLNLGTTTADTRTRMIGGNWRSTAAITSVTVALSADNLASGSIVELRAIP